MATKTKDATRVKYRDAAELAGALSLLAKEVKLPMAVAWRVALMRRSAEAAQEAFEAERTKINRDIARKRKTATDPTEREMVTVDAMDELRAKGAETFEVAGRLDYAVIQEAVGSEKVENLGNILAGLMPVLEGVPA